MKYTLLTYGLLMATSALATDTAAPGGANGFQALDTDGDRLISLAEAQAGAPELAARFSKIDANQDGLLSIDEVVAGGSARNMRVHRDMQEDFAAADGMLTRAEAAKMPIVSDFFGEMDSNVDGQITLDEIREHARKHGPVRVKTGLGPGAAKE